MRALFIVALFDDETIWMRITPEADPASLYSLVLDIEEGGGTFVYRTEDVEVVR